MLTTPLEDPPAPLKPPQGPLGAPNPRRGGKPALRLRTRILAFHLQLKSQWKDKLLFQPVCSLQLLDFQSGTGSLVWWWWWWWGEIIDYCMSIISEQSFALSCCTQTSFFQSRMSWIREASLPLLFPCDLRCQPLFLPLYLSTYLSMYLSLFLSFHTSHPIFNTPPTSLTSSRSVSPSSGRRSTLLW